MGSLSIKYKAPEDLKPRSKNPRTHSIRQIKQIAASIKQYGFINAVLIDGDEGIIAGHGRVEAAKLIGLSDIPTVCVDHLSPAQTRAYVIADNKLAENAGWDPKLLALELKELAIELNFDVTITGFETAEIDLILAEQAGDISDQADKIPAVDRLLPPVSRKGDLWRVGDHYLLCDDALNAESYDVLLGPKKAQLIITDPPYDVRIAGNVSGLGKNKHREFAMASGEMNPAEFIDFLRTVFAQLIAYSCDGSLHFIFMDWRHLGKISQAAQELYSELKNLCVWVKTNGGMGSLYRSQHELVFIFKNGTSPHINNIELGRFGRNRTNVWPYAGMNAFGKDRDSDLAMHPTVKPVALVADAILDCSKRGGIVLDAFIGSGTTLVAAEKTGRRGYGVEIDPHYVDTTIRRLEDVCGLKALHVNSKLSFEALSHHRLPSIGAMR